MEKMIAFCGIACDECPAWIATQADDDDKRAEAAKLWSKEYNTHLQAKDINCEGCQSDGSVLFGHCQVCEIRKCGLEMRVANCAYCHDYACGKLNRFFDMVPDAKKRLDGIRDSL
ncbi:DUF3795 domain-containing protein [bacterium]|nr:DUF3795 domain-containing protein [bacterium]RQV98961.1 MAG: DUF3795 domain-containing protein [bacterium]